jgi:chromosome segregation ATPase
MLNESKTSVNDFSTQHQMLSNQLDEIVQMISQLGPNDLSKEFPTSQEKLEYLKLRYGQVVSDRKHLVERCSSLEDENQNLVQAQQIYQQDLATLQDGVTILAAENETVKKQLSTEHQTVTCKFVASVRVPVKTVQFQLCKMKESNISKRRTS